MSWFLSFQKARKDLVMRRRRSIPLFQLDISYPPTKPLQRHVALSLIIVGMILNSLPAASNVHANASNQTTVPFEQLIQRQVKLLPALQGKHPRVFFTNESLKELRRRAELADRDLWQASLKDVRALRMEPPPPGSPMLNRSGVEQVHGDLSQYDIAYILAEVTFAYAVERDPRYLEAAKRWLLTIIKYDPWGYTFRTPNVDLPPAHFLYAVGFAYDVLFDKFTSEERNGVREKLVRQARLMFEYFKYKPKKRYSYSQNHTFIPMAGLGVAALALLGEEPEADDWAQQTRAVFDRTLETFGTDGYYYEGFHYSVFSMHWIVRYLDALEHATGEDLYPRMRERFQPLKYYIAHSILPDGHNVFDFGDTGRGAAERNSETTRKLNSAYEVLYRLAGKYKDSEAQGIAEWLRRDLSTTTWEKFWALYAHDPSVRPAPMSSLATFHYFRNSETVFWRSSWNSSATAFAFRCGPPEGHHAAELAPLLPDWRQNTGHAHPDANSFIIYSQGRYLTGDTGYTGVKQTKHHNTVLVGGRGQEKDGRHEVFKDVDLQRLNRLQLADIWSTSQFFYARGEASPAYSSELKLQQFDRHLLYVAPDYFIVWDELTADETHAFTWLVNAERRIVSYGTNSFGLLNGDVALFVHRVLPISAISQIERLMVTAQGRPGEVESGLPEQRGFQLAETTTTRDRHTEFLHFLQPAAVSFTTERPRVSALKETARGLIIEWPNGDKEVVLLRGSYEALRMNGERAVVRLSNKGDSRRVILQHGTRLAREGVDLLRSSQPVSVSLQITDEGKWWGTVSADAVTTISVRVRLPPVNLRVNDVSIKSGYNKATKTIRFVVGAGTSLIESD